MHLRKQSGGGLTGLRLARQVILVVKNKVALTHKCVEDYRLTDKSVLDLVHIKEVRRRSSAMAATQQQHPSLHALLHAHVMHRCIESQRRLPS